MELVHYYKEYLTRELYICITRVFRHLKCGAKICEEQHWRSITFCQND